REALLLILVLSGPPILTSLVVGLLISIFQATTQIQEQTLTFVPKIVLVFAILGRMGPWMISQVIQFTQRIYSAIPKIIGV
ncbi:MAG: flagellar biosynthesis protein FliQ, partial [Gemmatimonadetes bacterium]|nr:flagellar biosynthesis protein FliQ [Gemmatimonadota bacterium]